MRLAKIILLSSLACSAFLWAGTTGNIRGVITDKDTHEAIEGAVVVATSTALQGEMTAMTDKAGLYVITDLPNGTYTVTAMFAGATSERNGIQVVIDKTLNINLDLAMSGAVGEVYTINEKAPNIDVASSTVGVTVTKEYIENVPMGRDRNFDNAMSVLPSAGGDAYGTSIGGSTSPENTYVVDGLNTTDPSSGLMGTRLVLEFIDQFDVKEGGYGPEFGRATGGFVNAVTKGGSNEFHGSVFAYWRPSFFQVQPKLIKRAGTSITQRNSPGNYLNSGFEMGGPIVTDKLWFHVGYAPEFQNDWWIREIRPVKSAAGNLPERDPDGNLKMDDDVEKMFPQTFPSFAQTHQYTMKLTHLIDNENRHSLSLRGAPTWFNGAVGNVFDPSSPSKGMNGGPETFNFKELNGNFVSGVYNYVGEYFNKKFKLDSYIGAHYQYSSYSPSWPGINKDNARVQYFYSGLGLDKVWDASRFDPATALPSFCTGDFVDGTARCPLQNYSRYGFGDWADFSMIRFAEKVMFTNLIELAGLHQLKYGVDFEQLRSQKIHGYTGGGFFQDYGPGKDGGFFKANQYAVKLRQETAPMIVGKEGFPSIAQTLNWAAFLGDSYNPLPNLTINAGVRWEGQNFYGVQQPEATMAALRLAPKFSILDNWAPRVGGVWDFMGNGKSAVRFNYGRFFESIPMDINERAFGGEGQKISFFDRTQCKDAAGAHLDPLEVTDPAKQCQPFKGGKNDRSLGGEDSIVAPGMKGQYSDEFILSADVEPIPSWVFGVAGVYRYLGRIIEDMSTDGGNTYVFANPGEPNAGYPAAATFPKPIRNIFQVQFRVDKKVSEHFMLLGTYVISWAYGNYPGLFSANNGQLDPNLTSQYDLTQLIINRLGYLPQDRRHRIKLSGFYKAALKDFGVDVPLFFDVGLSGRVQSGSPYEVLGADDIYGADEIFLLPRGAGGHTPWTWSVDLNAGLGYEISKDVTAEVFAALYNLTNNQSPVAYDDSYTFNNVKPILGGDFKQLQHARNTDGNPVKVNPNFGNVVAYQAPFGAQIGFRLKF